MANTKEIIADLIVQRDRINAAIMALGALEPSALPKTVMVLTPKVAPVAKPAPVVKTRRKSRNRRPQGTFPAAIMALLNDRKSEAHTAKVITEMLPEYGVNGKRATRRCGVDYALRSLRNKGRIEQIGDTWRAVATA